MISDESSSDSETGRFKGKSEKHDQPSKSTSQRDNIRSTRRDRHSESSRFRREGDKKWEEKDRSNKGPRERSRYSRNSPIRRRRSNDRSPVRKRSHERNRRASPERFRTKDGRSNSRDRQYRSRAHKPAEHKKVIEEIQRTITPKEDKPKQTSDIKRSDKFDRGARDKLSSSPELKVKRSEIFKPAPKDKRKISEGAVDVVEDKDSDGNASEIVQPGSYYNMMPSVVKEKTENTSEIDSSDDEKLRAKLLKLEEELHQAKKKKHKKKHRKKDKTSKNEKDIETPTSVEVSSTTDIQDKGNTDASGTQVDTTEVTSTQKNNQVESNEEGEIISDDDSQSSLNIDPTDLRHKLKRSVNKSDNVEPNDLRAKMKSRSDVCGPALPPHLENYAGNRRMSNTEGPALPPHLRIMDRRMGPSIPDQLREKLAQGDGEIIRCESSEDEGFGPVPAGAEGSWSAAHRRLEERALHLKVQALGGRSPHAARPKAREQWMLELPDGKAKYLGLEARGFRPKEGPDMSDRSSWTDTPEEKARKQAGLEKEEDADTVLQREARARQLATRDEDQEKAVKKHKKKHKRDESLLEMHERKLKKKKKKSDKEGKGERRPFSRDVDLQVDRFDEAQKRSVIKKAQQLDSRFSRGEAKYL